MADSKKPNGMAVAFGYIIIALIVGAAIWGVLTALNHPKQTQTASQSKPAQAGSTKPQVASANEKLQAILSNLRKQYPHIDDSYIFSATKDPNSAFGKAGEYSAGAAFCDDYDTLYTPQDTNDTGGSSNAYGFECGGTIQVFRNEADAAQSVAVIKKITTEPNTGKCLVTTQGNSECSYRQIGNTVIHVSDVLENAQQEEYLDYLSQQITTQNL